ncbi:MAG: ribose 5-phosphate isomerase B [Puniceicoccales bacterium]|jgi:ribose 5-phosphate isomerase B|nr:ribose 5-phosphate isomerase B [Puniceicoccales bacterium]
MTVSIGSDHAGFALKEHLAAVLRGRDGTVVLDRGTHSDASCDYPDFAKAVAADVAAGAARFGVLVCSTGIGICIAANKVAGVRAALCANEDAAEMCRRHNDANILCLGARHTTPPLAEKYLRVFLDTGFEGGRHARRVAKIEAR